MKALYYGDTLQVLRNSIATESVDPICLDPPFNSNATYNVGFLGVSGRDRMRGRTAACSQKRKWRSFLVRSFIGRTERGFDFLGYHFGPEGLTRP